MKTLTAAAALALTTAFGHFSVKADPVAYMGVIGGNFGTIDLNTGVFTLLGTSGQTLAGMAVQNGTLYGSSYTAGNGILFSVNTANGSLTPIGTSLVDYNDFGSTTGGIYAVDINANLYSINSANGAATLIGPTGLSLGGANGWNSLSTGAGSLFFSNGTNLYTLNTTTGAATLVGNMGGVQIGAMVSEAGVLYGGQNSPSFGVDTLNPLTGAATIGPALTGTGNAFFGLAPVPEPSTFSLLAIVGLACIFRRHLASGFGKSQNQE